MQITVGISVIALLLAAIGLVGVMSYSVARRTNEIGVRVALGARGSDIGRMIVAESMQPVGLGLVVGLPLVLLAMRVLHLHLGTAASRDISSVVVAVAVLALCGLAAALVPARRASRIDPIEALRLD